ncbi:ribonuclease D [Bifidobacterium aemilianum]|uniref:Ribonuclease D n=1 Tax=Bifidobacterium aemilianum TaxID=2493120 RepID=A0A366KBZ3_9BIFI|nr:HRDC domain-containing protein [Bifidobacterium aemilianum]RBP98171.1 ribonuclease D [Bifidobacterium aemilianum]
MSGEPGLQTEPKEGVPEVTDTLEGFHKACERFAQAQGPLAADAERASGYRYGHEDWLVQFKRQGAGIVLFDPFALREAGADWEEFNQAIGSAVWILHDSLQDLPGFADLGMRPAGLYDTEVAARLLGLRHFGLAAVTEHYLNISLAKEHSAADWSYRPLPRDWRNYAALDVELLIELEAMLTADLIAAGKEEWARQEFEYRLAKGMGHQAQHPVPWMRISHFSKLNRDRLGQTVAKALWEERDRLAREYDIAPTLLLSDAAIIEAAQKKPRRGQDFRRIRSLNERVRIHMGTEQDKMFERYAPIQRQVKPSVWKRVIQEALNLPRDQWADQSTLQEEAASVNAPRSMKLWKERHPERYERLRRAKAIIGQIADDTHTPVDMVIKPQILRNLCWMDLTEGLDLPGFLREQGAREWQIGLVAESLSRGIM